MPPENKSIYCAAQIESSVVPSIENTDRGVVVCAVLCSGCEVDNSTVELRSSFVNPAQVAAREAAIRLIQEKCPRNNWRKNLPPSLQRS